MFQRYKGMFMVLASAAGFGTLAIFYKFAYAAGANATTILGFRFLIAALLFWALIKARGIKVEIDRGLLLKVCVLGGIGYGAMSSLFASTVNLLPASLAGMLLYTYPAQVSIISFLIGDEQFHYRKGLALLICFSGLWLVLGASFEEVNLLGLTFALSAAFVYSIYIVLGNRLLKQVDSLMTTTFVCSSAAIVFLTYGAATGELMLNIELPGWLAIIGIAIFATVIAILSFFAGMALVGATNASIISTVEPVVTVILSALLLGETISLVQTMGGALILVGVVLLQMVDKKTKKI